MIVGLFDDGFWWYDINSLTKEKFEDWSTSDDYNCHRQSPFSTNNFALMNFPVNIFPGEQYSWETTFQGIIVGITVINQKMFGSPYSKLKVDRDHSDCPIYQPLQFQAFSMGFKALQRVFKHLQHSFWETFYLNFFFQKFRKWNENRQRS